MPCHAAMVSKHPTTSPEKGVEDALAILKKEKVEVLPVVDDDGNMAGLFSIRIMMKNVLPVSFSVGGPQQAVSVRAAPGIAKRLKKTAVLKVEDVMDRKFTSVNPETPVWEGVNILVDNGAPLVVAESETGKYIGMITYQSALEELQRMKDSDS